MYARILFIYIEYQQDGDDDNRKQRHRHNNHNAKAETEDEDVDEVALRRYELNKLKYYFAVATCDHPSTAEGLYTEIDGSEMENSAMVFDLRFVPDDVEFQGRTIRDACTAQSMSLETYKPPDFIVKALQVGYVIFRSY